MNNAVPRPVYPFAAIVGQQQMRLALLLHAVDPALGGVLVRGRKGTAKSTAVRALAALLPDLESVEGCFYRCDPDRPATVCDDCAGRLAAGEILPRTTARVPLVELPIGASEDRVAGSLDLETAVQTGERRFEPGLLARANRGILYMDEVNLLGDHLVDLLLDAAALGRNYVEREGVSVSHPAQIMLVGTMNPEEGDLRPQLLDRFALAVEVEGLDDPRERAEAVRNRITFEKDPAGFARALAPEQAIERERLAAARALLPRVVLPPALLDLIVHLCVTFGVDGLRADLALYRAAVALSAYRGHLVVTEEDVRDVAGMVLAHRRRRQPFEQPGLDTDRLDEAMSSFQKSEQDRPEAATDASGDDPYSFATGVGGERGVGGGPQAPASGQLPPGGGAKGRLEPDLPADPPERRSVTGSPPDGLKLPDRLVRAAVEGAGRRLRAPRGRRGGSTRTAVPLGTVTELAIVATLCAAAPHQAVRRLARRDGPALLLTAADLRERVRRGRSGQLIVFVVDASGSMGARERMVQTKGAVLAFLLDAYRKRDQVAMVTFRGDRAEVVLPPTNSVDLGERRLAMLATGGRTPLATGLLEAEALIERARRGRRSVEPLIVLVSDGRANSAAAGADPWRAAQAAATRLRARAWPGVVLDTEQGRSGAGLGRTVAGWLGAEYLRLEGSGRGNFVAPGVNA